jgi:hypothetical protein
MIKCDEEFLKHFKGSLSNPKTSKIFARIPVNMTIYRGMIEESGREVNVEEHADSNSCILFASSLYRWQLVLRPCKIRQLHEQVKLSYFNFSTAIIIRSVYTAEYVIYITLQFTFSKNY